MHGLTAAARLVARLVDGRTVLSTLHGTPPLLLRRTGVADDGAVVVHLVGGAAGPLGGDDLRIELDVGPGAAVEVRSVAASIALPGYGSSSSVVRARVAGTLRWLPEPVVAARGCDHIGQSTVDVGTGGAVEWREEVVCGRYGEGSGRARLSLRASYGGRTLLAHDLDVGGPGWDGPAVLGGASAAGTLLLVPHRLEPRVLGPTAAVLPLAGPGTLISAVGDPSAVRAAVDHRKAVGVGGLP